VQLRLSLDNVEAARRAGQPRLASVGEPLPVALDEGVHILADLLFVLDPLSRNDWPGRIASDQDWGQAAERIAAAARLRTTEREQQFLTGALASSDPDLVLVPFLDATWPFLVTDRWLVSLDAERFEAVTALLNQEEQQPDGLAFRVYLATRARGLIVPILVWKLGSGKLFPISAQEVTSLASEARRPVLVSPTTEAISAVLDALLAASRMQVIAQMRRPDLGPVPDGHLAADLLAEARSRIETLPRGPLRDACMGFANHLEAGAEVPQDRTLSGALTEAIRKPAFGGMIMGIRQVLAAAAEIDLEHLSPAVDV
jgi:hypothetical protein